MKYTNSFETHKAIIQAFGSHLKSLIFKYKHSLVAASDQQAMKALRRRYERSYSLYHRRRDMCIMYTPNHLEMLEKLGVDGMSSDESDDESGPSARCYIHELPSRAAIVTPWLRLYDSLHIKTRQSGYPGAKRGAYAHIRIATHIKSKRDTFVAGLPKNAYDQAWLEKQPALEVVYPSDEDYPFVHDPNVIVKAFASSR